MLFNMTRPGGGSVVFEYTGEYSERVDLHGRHVVRLETSGTFTYLGSETDVELFILGGGGGAMGQGGATSITPAAGGGGGWRFAQTKLKPAMYEVVVGEGGAIGEAGGDTSAFGFVCTGGQGATSGRVPQYDKLGNISGYIDGYEKGTAGVPNGEGTEPNGGSCGRNVAPPGGATTGSTYFFNPGGPGYIDIYFS